MSRSLSPRLDTSLNENLNKDQKISKLPRKLREIMGIVMGSS